MSVFATATGIGSWPGTAAREAAQVVVGELAGALAYLTELPARGVGADMLGRAGGLLVDVAIDTVPRGYRIAARPGAVTRRAASLLDEDMDALEEAWETAGLRGCGRAVKVQAPGPVTLVAGLELANGHLFHRRCSLRGGHRDQAQHDGSARLDKCRDSIQIRSLQCARIHRYRTNSAALQQIPRQIRTAAV